MRYVNFVKQAFEKGEQRTPDQIIDHISDKLNNLGRR